MPTSPGRTTTADILTLIGGSDNVRASTHCATRLPFTLADEERADTAAVEALPEVLAVVRAAGQYQIVVGNDVPTVHRALQAELGQAGWSQDVARAGSRRKQSGGGGPMAEGEVGARRPHGNLLNQFMKLISSIFQPIVWALAATGLLKAFLSLGVQVGWLDKGDPVVHDPQRCRRRRLPVPAGVPRRDRRSAFRRTPIHGHGHRRRAGPSLDHCSRRGREPVRLGIRSR